MIVVADASPINYLVLIGQIEILPILFDRLLLPSAVHDELRRPGAPVSVREWALQLPTWCEVVSANSMAEVPGLSRLDPGETEAIRIAVTLSADFLLIDERHGRLAASARGLPLIGTIAVLEQAADRGLLQFSEAFEDLLRTNFRVSAQLRATYLDRR